jgi:flagellar protein FliO/FliZ
LGKLDNPIATPSTSRIAGQPASLAFKDKLVKAMAENMIGAKKEKAHD